MSPRRPPSRRHPPKVRRYPLTTQASDSSLKPRSCRIDGSATLTTVLSSTTISSPRQRIQKATQRLRSVITSDSFVSSSNIRRQDRQELIGFLPVKSDLVQKVVDLNRIRPHHHSLCATSGNTSSAANSCRH